MLVELGSLERKGGKFGHHYEPGELTLDDERASLASEPKVTGRVQRFDARVTVEGQIDAELRLECDRCLAAILVPVASVFEVEYVTPEIYQTEHTAELLEDDLALSVFDGEVIDIDEIVREQLLLALPAQVLCREECKGLCSTCGADRNLKECNCGKVDIDPRWSGLKEIADRKS